MLEDAKNSTEESLDCHNSTCQEFSQLPSPVFPPSLFSKCSCACNAHQKQTKWNHIKQPVLATYFFS